VWLLLNPPLAVNEFTARDLCSPLKRAVRHDDNPLQRVSNWFSRRIHSTAWTAAASLSSNWV
jgi:hypothetical protein